MDIMRITCPECFAQFDVPDGAIKETGRKLRCGQCKHQWHQLPIPDEPPEIMETPTEELESKIYAADWITIGIMASNDYEAIQALKSISKKYSSIKFRDLNSLQAYGSVFLKANQKTGNVFVRSENGLGEGILITSQYEDAKESNTFGPLPLDFFT